MDNLLDLDGQTFFIDAKHYVRFIVKEVMKTMERPHGLRYSLTHAVDAVLKERGIQP